MTEEQMIAAAGDRSEQKLIKAYFEYIKAKYKYRAMLEAYTKGEPVYIPSVEIVFPDDRAGIYNMAPKVKIRKTKSRQRKNVKQKESDNK